jgi:hypothetical protein
MLSGWHYKRGWLIFVKYDLAPTPPKQDNVALHNPKSSNIEFDPTSSGALRLLGIADWTKRKPRVLRRPTAAGRRRSDFVNS